MIDGFERRSLVVSFLMGLQAATVQVMLIREILSLLRGNELVIGIVFGAWFLGIYIGATASSRMSEAFWSRSVAVSCIALPLVALTALYASHLAAAAVRGAPGSFINHSAEMMLAFTATLPVSLPVGFFFPPLVSILSKTKGPDAGGSVFCVESVGSFAGGIVFSFLVIDRFNPLTVLLALCAASIIIVSAGKPALVIALVIFGTSIFGDNLEKRFMGAVWPLSHAGQLVRHERSRYQRIAVERMDGQVSIYANGTVLYTLPDHYETRNIFHLIQALRGDRRRILMYGAPPGALARNLAVSGADVSIVEPDRALWQIYDSPFSAGSVAHPRHIERDMVYHLNHTDRKYDMIVSLAHAPENLQMNRFFTVEYYRRCRERLAPGGIMIVAMQGFSNFMGERRREYIMSLYKAFMTVFPHCVPTSGEVIYLLAGRDGPPFAGDPVALIDSYAKKGERYEAGNIDREYTENYSPDELYSFFEKSQREYFASTMATSLHRVEANSDTRPRGFWKYLAFSLIREDSMFVKAPVVGWLLIAAAAAMSTALLIRLGRRYGRFQLYNGIIMACTGYTGISCMIALIVLYQQYQGAVYYRIALVNAVFMLGLAAGSLALRRPAKKTAIAVIALMLLCQPVMAAYAVSGAEPVFWAALAIVSFVNGGVFPLLFATSPAPETTGTAGVLDASDHFGALIGSVATSLAILPFLGIYGVIALNCLSVAVITVSYMRRNGARAAAGGGFA